MRTRPSKEIKRVVVVVVPLEEDSIVFFSHHDLLLLAFTRFDSTMAWPFKCSCTVLLSNTLICHQHHPASSCSLTLLTAIVVAIEKVLFCDVVTSSVDCFVSVLY